MGVCQALLLCTPWDCRGRLAGSGGWVHLLPFPWVILSRHPPSAEASAWESLACSPQQFPESGLRSLSHPDAHLPLPGVLATWGRPRECLMPVGSEPGDVSQTLLKAQKREGGEPDRYPDSLIQTLIFES